MTMMEDSQKEYKIVRLFHKFCRSLSGTKCLHNEYNHQHVVSGFLLLINFDLNLSVKISCQILENHFWHIFTPRACK